MARAVGKRETRFEPAFEPAVPHQDFAFGAAGQGATHARALQLRLAESFAATAGGADVPHLGIRTRAALIVGSAVALWLVTGAGALALLG